MKKFLFTLLILLFIFIPFNVFAYVNTNTTYTITFPDVDFTDDFFNNLTYQELLDYYSNYESDYYNLMVIYSNQKESIQIRLYPKNLSSLEFTSYGYSSAIGLHDVNRTAFKQVILYRNTSFIYTSSNTFTTLNNCIENNICWSSSDMVDSNYFGNANWGEDFELARFNSTNINNSNSYNIDTIGNTQYLNNIYSSDIPVVMNYIDTNITSYYVKRLILNDNDLQQSDLYLTYTDIYSPVEIEYLDMNYLHRFLVGGISPNDINSFNYTLKFFYEDKSYLDNISPYFYFYGRVNHGTYYSYEKLDCTSYISFRKTFESDDNYVTIDMFPNGFSCSSNLQNIENIYLTTDFIELESGSNTNVYFLEYNVNKGYGTFNNNYRIYERFNNLNHDFSLSISTLEKSSSIEYKSNNKFVLMVSYERDTLELSRMAYDILDIGTIYNTNAMIYEYPNNENLNVNLELFVYEDVILSFKQLIDGQDVYTYYDENKSLVTGYIDNDVVISINNNYNVDFYDNFVSNYIKSLSSDIIEISKISQSFYDSLPISFQSFIYVCFILVCFYFVFVLIKRR